MTIKAEYERLLPYLLEAAQQAYGERLVSLVVFGSVGRGTPRPDSDIDLLVVADPLPDGRLRRVAEFRVVEDALQSRVDSTRSAGIHVELSPVFKTPAEVRRGSPLFLDLTEDARLLFDRDDFFSRAMDQFRARLERLGARRIWRGSAWYWDLKPDYQPGDVFDL